MNKIDLHGFRLSNEQLAYLRTEYYSFKDQIADPDETGKFRLVARQEALLMMFRLHKFEVDRLSKLGDNLPLIEFLQQKDDG